MVKNSNILPRARMRDGILWLYPILFPSSAHPTSKFNYPRVTLFNSFSAVPFVIYFSISK